MSKKNNYFRNIVDTDALEAKRAKAIRRRHVEDVLGALLLAAFVAALACL